MHVNTETIPTKSQVTAAYEIYIFDLFLSFFFGKRENVKNKYSKHLKWSQVSRKQKVSPKKHSNREGEGGEGKRAADAQFEKSKLQTSKNKSENSR